jgi:hypothetical protein
MYGVYPSKTEHGLLKCSSTVTYYGIVSNHLEVAIPNFSKKTMPYNPRP